MNMIPCVDAFTQAETRTPGKGSFATYFNRSNTNFLCFYPQWCCLGKQFKSWALRTDAPVKKKKYSVGGFCQ